MYPYYNEVPRYLLYQWVCNCLSVMLGSIDGIAVSSGLSFNTIGPRGLLLTHWGRVTHICVSKLTIISSDNGLSPGRRQAIIWTNAWILLIRTLGTNFSEILSEIHAFSFKIMHLKMSSGKRRPSCLGLNVLSHCLNNCWINIELYVTCKQVQALTPGASGAEFRVGYHGQQIGWGRDKMAAIFQTTFSDAFSWMKIYELRLFRWSLFPRVKLTIFQHWFR